MEIGCESASIITDERLFTLTSYNISFIGRYLNYAKYLHSRLSPSEAQRISAAGLYIVSIYGGDSMGKASFYTYDRGKKDVIEALSMAIKIGQPSNTPIYFAVDCDNGSMEMKEYIEPYFQAISSVIENKKFNPNNYKLGIYGSRRVCAHIRGRKPATERYTWVADSATSSGYFDDWNIMHGAAVTLGSGNAGVEINRSWASEYGDGGWQLHSHTDTVWLTAGSSGDIMRKHDIPLIF